MYLYAFEKLHVWVDAKEFATLIYHLVKQFPNDEKFGLTSLLKRASISICSNIAQGSARKTNKNKAHLTTMAFSAAVEVINQLIISYELDFITEEQYLESRKN